MPAASSHARSERTGQTSTEELNGTGTTRPRPSWSVLSQRAIPEAEARCGEGGDGATQLGSEEGIDLARGDAEGAADASAEPNSPTHPLTPASSDSVAGRAARSFRGWPVDWREWLVDNAHRLDAAVDVPDRFDDAQFEIVFPYDEIRTMQWNGNPYAVKAAAPAPRCRGPGPGCCPTG
jgi:hypothetical protein